MKDQKKNVVIRSSALSFFFNYLVIFFYEFKIVMYGISKQNFSNQCLVQLGLTFSTPLHISARRIHKYTCESTSQNLVIILSPNNILYISIR